jgi:multidrug efflux system membrane fusion protein
MDGPDKTNPVARAVGGKIAYGVVASIAIAGVAIFLTWPADKGRSAQPPASATPAAIPVETALVSTQDVPIERSGLGFVTPLTAVDVKVRVEGQLQKVLFSEGQNVQAGDVLAEIDPRPYEAAVNQAQAAYQKDMAQLSIAKLDDERAKKLIASGGGTTQASQTATAQVAIMEATAAGEQAAIDTAKLNLSFATVTAPISGRVGFRQAEQGGIVHATDTAGLVTITQMRPIAVQFSLSQDELPDLVAGQANGTLAVAVDTRDRARHLADGKLSVIDSQVDTATGMVKLKAVFANDDLALWPGELVTARIILRTDHGSTVAPSAAIQNGQGGSYVFVVKPDQTVATVSVTTGPVSSGMTAFLSGVATGDNVVTSGQSRLTDGTLVKAQSSKPQKTASAEGQVQ